MEQQKVVGRPFEPGKSGNPSGRPKIPEQVKELARGYTVEAIQTLAAVMKDVDAPHSARIKASETLLDRAWGKAESTVNVRDISDVSDLTTAEILAALATHGIAGSQGVGEADSAVHSTH